MFENYFWDWLCLRTLSLLPPLFNFSNMRWLAARLNIIRLVPPSLSSNGLFWGTKKSSRCRENTNLFKNGIVNALLLKLALSKFQKKSIWWEFSYSLLTGWFSRTASRFSRHGENRVYKGSSSLQLIGGGTPVGGERAPAVLTGCPLFREASEKEVRCTSTQGAVPTGKTCNPSHMCVFR